MATDVFDEELGGYVGAATNDEVVRALADHTPGEVVVRLTDANGDAVWQKRGWMWEQVTSPEETVFIVAGEGETAGQPLVYVDPPLVFNFGLHARRRLDADLHIGGVRIRFDFGPFKDHTMTILLWHSVLHITEDGDVAPGFGGFQASLD